MLSIRVDRFLNQKETLWENSKMSVPQVVAAACMRVRNSRNAWGTWAWSPIVLCFTTPSRQGVHVWAVSNGYLTHRSSIKSLKPYHRHLSKLSCPTNRFFCRIPTRFQDERPVLRSERSGRKSSQVCYQSREVKALRPWEASNGGWCHGRCEFNSLQTTRHAYMVSIQRFNTCSQLEEKRKFMF